MTPTPHVIHRPPEMELIRERRKALGLSYARAGERAGISDTWWRFLEDGRRKFRGSWFTEVAPASTLARMAMAVGVTPAQLADAGRPDAVPDLERLQEKAAELDAGARREAEQMVATVTGLTGPQREALIRKLAGDIRQMREES